MHVIYIVYEQGDKKICINVDIMYKNHVKIILKFKARALTIL